MGGFHELTLFEFAGEPDDSALLHVTLTDNRELFIGASYGHYPSPTPYIVPVTLIPVWLQRWYDTGLARWREKDVHIAPFGPRDHTEAKGHWAITTGNRLSPNLTLSLYLGQTDTIMTVGANEIVSMKPTTTEQALAMLLAQAERTSSSDPAHT